MSSKAACANQKLCINQVGKQLVHVLAKMEKPLNHNSGTQPQACSSARQEEMWSTWKSQWQGDIDPFREKKKVFLAIPDSSRDTVKTSTVYKNSFLHIYLGQLFKLLISLQKYIEVAMAI